jgi:hypothetical protein
MLSIFSRILFGKNEQVSYPKRRTTRHLPSTHVIANAMRAVTKSRLKGPASDPRQPLYPRLYARIAAEAASALARKRMPPNKKRLLLHYLRGNRGRRRDTGHFRRNDAEQLLADNAAMSLLCKQPTWALQVLEHLRELEAHCLSWGGRNLLIEELIKALEEGETSLNTWLLQTLMLKA